VRKLSVDSGLVNSARGTGREQTRTITNASDTSTSLCNELHCVNAEFVADVR